MRAKQAIDEIQSSGRTLLDPTHLAAFALGAVVATVLLVALGSGHRAGGVPIHEGTLSYVEEQISPDTRGGSSYSKEDGIRGRLYEQHLLIDRSGSTEVIPAHRLHQAKFHR